jgi:coproporphyrinogen III oxidase-like Fe-S oxidoreductase
LIRVISPEIEIAKETVGEASVPTIFFGGGTPSLMPAYELGRVITSIRSNFNLASDAEVTIEVNPDLLHPYFWRRCVMREQPESQWACSLLSRMYLPL